MRVTNLIPTPEVILITARPTGLELYQVSVAPLPPLALLIMPGERAHLGGWALAESARQLELATPALVSTLARAVISGVLPACRSKGVEELSIRMETGMELAPLPWGEILPEFRVRYRYRKLVAAVAALQERLENDRIAGPALTVSPLEVSRPVEGALWNDVLPFPSWFVRLFESIFTPETDREISEAPGFQLALLELIMAAAWQTPTMSVLYRHEEPVGMVLSRPLLPDRGELSFVGLSSVAQGQAGYGIALMSAALGPLPDGFVETVLCAVAEDNPRSLAFFERKWGFSQAGREEVLSLRL